MYALYILGAIFETPFMFRRHVQDTCQHEARVYAIACRICHIKLKKSVSIGSNQAAVINANESEVSNNKYTQGGGEVTYRKIEQYSQHEELVEYRSVMAHLYQAHVKLFYRCTACPRAFAAKEAIYEHRAQAHDGIYSLSQVKDDKGIKKTFT